MRCVEIKIKNMQNRLVHTQAYFYINKPKFAH
jgi:hypothetical protein